MIEGGSIDTAGAAFLAGLITSFHCVGMCGPLACGVAGGQGATAHAAAALYHGGRFFSYTVLGVVAGAIGAEPLSHLMDGPAVLFPWAVVMVFLMVAFGLDKKMPKPKCVQMLLARIKLKVFRMPAVQGAGLLGLITPLLPCAPLYLVLTTALLSGSAATGGEFMAAFALGTVPLLWVAQGSFNRLRSKISPRGFDVMRKSLALAAAAMMVWRLRGTLFFIENSQGVPDCCIGG